MGSRKEKKESRMKEQVRKSRIKQLQQDSLRVSTCMCIFLDRSVMHGISCGSFLSCNGFFLGVTMFFSLALPFPNSFDEMDSHTSVELYCWMDRS